ncbi:MAG: LytTR family DNA-binding domain-containing protein [Bacteroidota bacterium]
MTALVVDDDPLARELLQRFVERHDALALAGACADAIEADNTLQTAAAPVDVVFLDVEMPEMSGIEWAETRGPDGPQVVLVTSEERYARAAFDVEATDYIVKPATYGRFLKAVERVRRRAMFAARPAAATPASGTAASGAAALGASASGPLFVRVDGRLVRVDLADLAVVEAKRDYAMLCTDGGDLLIHSTMRALEARLPDDAFVRVHRSFIVRLDRIEDVEDGSVAVGRRAIPVSASRRRALLDRLNTL